MKKLLTLTDRDVFAEHETEQTCEEFYLRSTVKIILFDQNMKLALVGVRYRLLPGGGVEKGESIEEAAKRECLEEVGCHVEIKKEIGFTEEYREKIQRHQTTHFLLANVLGEKGLPQTTQEDEQGMQVEWYGLDEALKLLERQVVDISPESYHSCFNVRTHLVALKETKAILES